MKQDEVLYFELDLVMFSFPFFDYCLVVYLHVEILWNEMKIDKYGFPFHRNVSLFPVWNLASTMVGRLRR